MESKLTKKQMFLPFTLTLVGFVVDQLTKMWILTKVEPYQIYKSFFGDFINLRLVFNKGAAFSLGSGFAEVSRILILGILPLIALGLIILFYFKTKEITYTQRWLLAGILGGGFGNILDRFVRTDGVVDFIDVKFFGLFGLERWPTFNVADSIVVVCGILLVITLIVEEVKHSKEKKNNKTEK